MGVDVEARRRLEALEARVEAMAELVLTMSKHLIGESGAASTVGCNSGGDHDDK